LDVKNKVTTVRFDEEQLAALVAMSSVEGGSVAEEIRQAVQSRINQRRQDPEFLARLQESRQRNLRALQITSEG
jgi:hypothetical protein